MNDKDKSLDIQSVNSTKEERSNSFFFRSISTWILHIFGRNVDTTWQESLEELIEEEEDISEQITPKERDLLMNLIHFGRIKAEEAMVPRPDIVAVEESSALDEIVSLIKKNGHSRMPVYRDTLDEVVGMVHIRDVMAFWGSSKNFNLPNITRPLLFAPQSMPIIDLLAKMRTSRLHMAIIVDEYGGTDGLVTIENLVEEIVGEIEDEHDALPSPTLKITVNGIVEADARTPIRELEAHFDVVLRSSEIDEEVETVGGLVSRLAGKVPLLHDRLNHPAGLSFEIIDADPRRVKQVRVSNTASATKYNKR